jgi:hypothetical protein
MVMNIFEYLLRDHGYLSEEMFIMKKIERCGMGPNVDQDVIRAYNKMHVKYRMLVECEIGELKRKSN